MKKLYRVKVGFEYLAWTSSPLAAEQEVSDAIFYASFDDMNFSVIEINPGDDLPYGWDIESRPYGIKEVTIKDCLAEIESRAKQVPLAIGDHEEESE